jgi:hypothetical protein
MRIANIRQSISQAEKAFGGARHDQLTRLSTTLNADKANSCDVPRIGLLQKSLTDLSNVVVP